MLTAWRITKSAYADRAFDGEGARLHGGRWNSPGTRVVYTAQTESLAVLELLVHLQESALLASYCSIPVRFNDALVEVVDPKALSAGWRDHPSPLALQEFGDQWAAERRSVVLQVPSAIVPSELLYIMNADHPDFGSVSIGAPRAFELDRRLV